VLIAGGINNNHQTLNSAELYNPATGTFAYTGSLNHDRTNHSAVLLANGLVLIAGGQNNDGSSMNSTELYNPATGKFTYTNPLLAQIYSFPLVLLKNGDALTVGGWDSFYGTVGVFELFNPTTDTFSSTGDQIAVTHHSATLLQNGKVLIAGGRYLYFSNHTEPWAFLYDPTTGGLSQTGSLPHDVANHTATLLQNGKVLVAAGVNNDGQTLSIAELYTPGP
jgi:hypothetical protein